MTGTLLVDLAVRGADDVELDGFDTLIIRFSNPNQVVRQGHHSSLSYLSYI